MLLLCLPHHAEVDDKKTGGRFYPPELLRRWKTDHEGSNAPALAALGRIDEESLTELLLNVFAPPVERLQRIADQLEKTGTLNAETVGQLRQIVQVMRNSSAAADRATAALLMEAAEVYSSRGFRQAANELATAADILPSLDRSLSRTAAQLLEAADLMGR